MHKTLLTAFSNSSSGNRKSKTCTEPFDGVYPERSRRAQDKLCRRIQNLKSLKLVERNPEGTGRINQPAIIAGEPHHLSLPSEKVNRCQMESVQGSDWLEERLQSPCEYRPGEFNKSNAAQERPHFVSMRSSELTHVNPSPDFVLKKAAGDQRLLPKFFRGQAVFCQKMSERNRAVEIDHRSLRSRFSSRSNSRKDMTGLRGGEPAAEREGGVIQPWRAASASKASASTGLLLFSGGTSSATTRSRSVTSTVSPCAARRTYSLSLFLRTFKPTDLMALM